MNEPKRYDVAAVIKAAIRESNEAITEERMATLIAAHAPEIPEASRPLAVKELASGFATGGYVLLGFLYAGLKASGKEAEADAMVEETVHSAFWIDDTKGEATVNLWAEKADLDGDGKPLVTINAKL